MTHPDFRRKLEAIGFGVFIPVFFVTSGVRFDLGALTGERLALAMVPLFLARAARRARRARAAVPPARPPRDARGRPAAGDVAAVPRRGHGDRARARADRRRRGAALVGAGLLSVLLFPAAGLALLPRRNEPRTGIGSMQTTARATPPTPRPAPRSSDCSPPACARIASACSSALPADHRADAGRRVRRRGRRGRHIRRQGRHERRRDGQLHRRRR